MQYVMDQRPSLRLRMRARLYYLATRDVEFGELLLAAVAMNRVVLLRWPPFELSILGFYAPLVTNIQLILWFALTCALLASLVSGSERIRAASLLASSGLWVFAGWTTFVYAESPQLALSPFIFAAFSFGIVLRLGARWRHFSSA